MTSIKSLVDQVTDADTREAFYKLDESEHHSWTMSAIAEFSASDKTPASRQRYIGKIALVLNYDGESNERP